MDVKIAPFPCSKKEYPAVFAYTLSNANGLTATILSYGATLQSVSAPVKTGSHAAARRELVLGCPSLDGYLKGTPYWGATVGRYANRIAKGHFKLDGQDYNLHINCGPDHLHGGKKGFDKQNWLVADDKDVVLTETAASVTLHHTSSHMDEGYPGTVSVSVTYTLSADNALAMTYRATTDRTTHINLTNHSYWNLDGADPEGRDTVLNHQLQLSMESYLDVDDTLIPTGEVCNVAKHPAMDFRESKRIGDAIDQVGGYDHCYVVNTSRTSSTETEHVARAVGGDGRVTMDVFTSEPGVQFYSSGAERHALCLEAQHFPDTPNHLPGKVSAHPTPLEFPTTLLGPGEEYRQVTRHVFTF